MICPNCNKELKRIINIYTPENKTGDWFCYECDKIINNYDEIWKASRNENKKGKKGRILFIGNETTVPNEEFYKQYKILKPMEEI